MSVAIDNQAAVHGRLVGLFDELNACLDEVFELPASVVGDDELVAAIGLLPGVEARLAAAQSLLLEMARNRALHARRGSHKLANFVQANTTLSGFEARARIKRCEWLHDFAGFGRAHEAGVMSVEHLELIRKRLDNPRTHLALRRNQGLFIDAARDCSFKDFEKVCDYWKIAADPDGAEPVDQVARTSFRAKRQSDGMVKLDGLLDPLTGHAFLTAWDAEAQKLAITDHEIGQHRSQGVRGAEALLRLVAKGAARADGSHSDPLIHIVMSQKVAEAAMQRFAFGADVPIEVDPFDVDGRCELIDGTPLHPRLALAVLGVAALQRAVLDAKSRPLDVSYASRGFPKWLKHILALRSRGRCESDGCDAPYAWLQADHDLAHSKGGPTSYANANLYCRPDNLVKGNR
jgi:hypothetical protein